MKAQLNAEELSLLSNISEGVSAPLDDLIYIYETARAKGIVHMEDMRQLASRGIPIFHEVAKVLDIPLNELKHLIESGKVGFDLIQKAFHNMAIGIFR